MPTKKIVFLASDCESSRWIFNALKQDFLFDAVIIEEPVGKITLIKNRVKKIGGFKVLGQILFSVLVVPLLQMKARRRKEELVKIYDLDGSPISNDNFFKVSSVNDDTCLQRLEQLKPDIVLVNGTRIISKRILNCTKAVFINMHVGITPWYRGSHGGYWALYQKDPENFGTTIHLVDAGVDTGSILKQVFTQPAETDNFTTYPVLQTAVGIAALREMLQLAVDGNLAAFQKEGKGKMYYQPTIWQYLVNRVKTGTN